MTASKTHDSRRGIYIKVSETVCVRADVSARREVLGTPEYGRVTKAAVRNDASEQ